MKILFRSIMLVFALSSISCKSQTNTKSFVKTLGAAEFKQLVDKGDGIILDVRTPEEVAAGHIANASSVNFYDENFQEKIKLMAHDKEIYLYCAVGGRSAEAAQIMQSMGFSKIYQLGGGITSWKQHGFATVADAPAADEKIQHLTLEQFKTVINTDKLVLIDFHTKWCAPCRKMAPVIDKIEKDFEGKAVVMRVDVEKSTEVGQAYEITGVPVFMLFKQGKVVWQQKGLMPEADLVSQLTKHI